MSELTCAQWQEPNSRFVIDSGAQREGQVGSEQQTELPVDAFDKLPQRITWGAAINTASIYLLPPSIRGYSLSHKKWCKSSARPGGCLSAALKRMF